jgi:xanthine dehydrogenase FAD-binding subunit
MIPVIEFLRPKTIAEALSLLAENQGDTHIIAGSTDIMPGFQQGSSRFQNIKKLIDINQITELKTIAKNKHNIIVGAGVTFSELMKSAVIQDNLPLLAKAASTVGSVQIRNRATVGGNFINNAPCADSVPPLLIYEAKIRIRSQKHQRELSLQQILSKPYHTQLMPDELVTQIVLSVPSREYKGDFYKLGRRRGVAISRITLAVLTKIENVTIQDIRIASGAITPIGMRFSDLEEFARGKQINDELIKGLAQKLGQSILDKTGLRWSSAYKLPVVQQMFYQLLKRDNQCP